MAVHVRPLIANELTDGCSVCLELDEDRPQVNGEVVQGLSPKQILASRAPHTVSARPNCGGAAVDNRIQQLLKARGLLHQPYAPHLVTVGVWLHPAL